VGLPLKWVLATHAEVPQLPEADVASFLQIEAERGFPCDAATLQTSTSRCALGGGKQYALLTGIPRNHLVSLDNALRAAKLQPISFSLGVAALQPVGAEASNGVMALTIGESHVGLQVTCGGGVPALRALEGALEQEGGRRSLRAELVAREARITLGQLPAELRDAVKRIRIFGPRDLAQQLADELELRLEPLGLKVEPVLRYAAGEFGVELPVEAAVSPALSLAAGKLVGRGAPFEFLPPRVTAWQQLTSRYSSGKLGTVGAAAAAVGVLVAAAFGYQQFQLVRFGAQWLGMREKVNQLQAIQNQIKQYRPWYDESARTMTIMKLVTQAFPEEGSVTAKVVEIRDPGTVTCSGQATDYNALLRTLELLRKTTGVSEVRLNTIRGKSPMQFTFDFHWTEGGRSEN
jgi:hypothetical protein